MYPTIIPTAIVPPHPTAIDPAFARRLISTALERGGDYAEVFNEYRRDRVISVRANTVDTATESISRGLAIRVQVGAATGHAFCETDDEKDLLNTAKLAAQIARNSSAGCSANPLNINWKAGIVPHSFYPMVQPIAKISVSDQIVILKRATSHAEQLDKRVINISTQFISWERWIQVFGSDGTNALDFQPMVAILIRVVLRDGDRQESGFASRAGRAGMEFFTIYTPESAAAEAVERAKFNFIATPCPAGTMPVITAPGGAGILVHEAVGHGLEGDFNRKGVSSFSGQLGKMVASELCTIIDDGTVPSSSGAINIDDEGTRSQHTILIENGRLLNYMQDKLNARIMGVESTGNGRRQSYGHSVMPRMRVTSMANGPHDPEEIIASVSKGLYAKQFGVGNVEIVKGDYNFQITEAYLIENGKLGRPVRGATLIGNGPETMRTISMVGNDLKFDVSAIACGKYGQRAPVSFGTPTMKVGNLVVGGVA